MQFQIQCSSLDSQVCHQAQLPSHMRLAHLPLCQPHISMLAYFMHILYAGVGKTTVIREMARVLADDYHKRVVIVDTSNELGPALLLIVFARQLTRANGQLQKHSSATSLLSHQMMQPAGGDGDVPHPAIGGARRMQVPDPSQQHKVMVRPNIMSIICICLFPLNLISLLPGTQAALEIYFKL